MITGIDHIEFCVGNIEAVADYFANMGFTKIRKTDHHGGAIELRMPGDSEIIFEFHYGKPTETPGLNHIAFKVDDMEETFKEFTDNGIKFEGEPKTSGNRGVRMANTRCPAHMRYQFVE